MIFCHMNYDIIMMNYKSILWKFNGKNSWNAAGIESDIKFQ